MKNGSMQTGRFTAMLAAVVWGVCGSWGAAGACAQPLPEPVPVASAHCATGDIDGDGLIDVVVSSRSYNVVRVFQAVDDSNFVLAGSWEVAEAAAVVLADFDGDGELDLAYGSSADDSVTMAYGFGDFSFAIDNDNAIMAGVSPGILSVFDHCDGELPDVLVANNAQTTIVFVQSPTLNPVITPVTSSFEFPNCPEGMSEGPCNNYTEPDCESNSQGEGIQECMRAAKCRAAKCRWAACILYEDDDGFGSRSVRYAGRLLACTGLFVVENTLCLPSDLVK